MRDASPTVRAAATCSGASLRGRESNDDGEAPRGPVVHGARGALPRPRARRANAHADDGSEAWRRSDHPPESFTRAPSRRSGGAFISTLPVPSRASRAIERRDHVHDGLVTRGRTPRRRELKASHGVRRHRDGAAETIARRRAAQSRLPPQTLGPIDDHPCISARASARGTNPRLSARTNGRQARSPRSREPVTSRKSARKRPPLPRADMLGPCL